VFISATYEVTPPFRGCRLEAERWEWHPPVKPAAGHDNNRTGIATMRNSIRYRSIDVKSVLQYKRQFYPVLSCQLLSRQAAVKEIESAFSLGSGLSQSPRPKRPRTTTLRLRVRLAVNTAHKQLRPDLIPTNTQRPLHDTRRPPRRHSRLRRDS
jgi:hypothetical protein